MRIKIGNLFLAMSFVIYEVASRKHVEVDDVERVGTIILQDRQTAWTDVSEGNSE